jgi:hypothetical protein
MEMSLPWAEFISYWANWILVGALLVGVISTIGIVVSTNAKEHHWDQEKRLAALRISTNESETARANERAGEAIERAAQADRKTAEAQLELFKLKAPRQLNSEVFRRELAGKPKWQIVEFWFVDASDCRFFAMEITVELAQAGWIAALPKPLQGANVASEHAAIQSPIESWGAHPTGVSIVANSIEDGSPQAALRNALANALPGWQVTGSRDSSMRPGTLRIVVAPRL